MGVRLQPKLLGALESWIADQPVKVSRPEAVRTLLASALDVKTSPSALPLLDSDS